MSKMEVYHYEYMGNEVYLTKSGEKRLPRKGEYYLYPQVDNVGRAASDFQIEICEILVPIKQN
jgi:hypothetical protein